MPYNTLASDSEQVYPIIGRSDVYDRTGDTRIPVREDNMNSVRASGQEKKRTLVLGGTGKTGQHTGEVSVVTYGHRQAVGTITMLLGMVVALTLVLAACGGGQVDASQSGMTIGSIAKSELGPGKSASGIFDLAPGNYVLICNLWGHYADGMYTAFEVIDEADSQGATVNVELGEWFVNADSASVTAGSITFDVSNRGGQTHEFIIIQTDLAPDALAVK